MAFDPSVIGSIGDSAIPNVTGAVKEGFALRDMMDEHSLNQFKLREAKQSEADEKVTRSILSKYDITKADDASKASAELQGKGLTSRAMDVQKANQGYVSGQYENEINALKLQQGLMDFHASLFDPIYQKATELHNDGKHTDAEVTAYITSQIPTVIKSIKEAPESVLPANLKQAALQKASQTPTMTYQQLQDVELSSKQQREKIQAGMAKLNVESEIKNREGTLAERVKHDRAMESKQGATQDKAPTGFQWSSDHTALTPIPGGPKDPQSSNMSGRQAVYFTRVAAAGNEAATAIQNIANLPTGASSGVFGVGRTPGESLTGSAKGALTNKLSSQDVQDYNTMLAGVNRNLATIETAGLAPTGSLTGSMGSLELRAGDTGITKLRKMAEMRQIVEKGLEPNLSDPRIPEPQKAVVRKIIDQVKKAVPYTQDDVTRLQQSKNKRETLTDEMKEQGLSQGGPATTDLQAAAAAELKRRQGGPQ